MGELFHEFSPLVYIMTVLLFHFMKHRTASRYLKIATLSYCLIRLTFSCLTFIVVFVSLFSNNNLTQKINPAFDTLSTLLNMCHLVYICTSKHGFIAFHETVKISAKSQRKMKKYIWAGISFGIVLVAPLFIMNAMYFLGEHSDKHEHIDFIFGSTLSYFGLDIQRYRPFLITYFFIDNGMFGPLTYVFTPIFYSAISIKVAMKFREWHESLVEKITLECIYDEPGVVEMFRMKYEHLMTVIRMTERFLSSFLGINLILHVANICFLSYNVITYWDVWKEFSIYIIYGIIIISILVFSCSMITCKVSRNAANKDQNSGIDPKYGPINS